LTRRQVDYWRDGMALFERALAVSGENDTIRYNLCVEASRLGRLDVAFANCRAAVRATVPRPGERPSLATVLERQGWRPARAAEQAGSLTAALGVAAWQAGRVGDATEYFAETVRLEPARADARNNLGLAYSTTGRAPEALAELGEALRLDPAYADARYNRGNVLANLGRFDEAVADYRAALTASPDLHEAGNNLGVVLERSGDVAGAERAYRATIERAPSYADPRTNLATLLVAQGRQAEAQALRASTPGAAELPQADAGPGGAPTREQE
ncbi:MAG: tetratricopeptide repeat protein, partial [Deltaproteobacteria bacterium]|nr:tetratricopeptide repeat protein [Deltaproteobacteria bacterium]